MADLRIGVLVSGSGSNLQALIDLCTEPEFPANIALVISNKPGVRALERATSAGIPNRVVAHRDYSDHAAFDAALDSALKAAEIELVCLAGFMRILTDELVEGWRDRMINIHPALLPAFKGLDTHRRALEAGVRIHGCTVHYVRPDLDTGPILVQAAVPVLPGDDEASLASRVLDAEHRAYPLALRLIVEGKARVEGDRVAFGGSVGTGAPLLINPSGLPNPALLP